jgi:Protein of unknown function DUF262/Protein of unknown function (DUF1524)
LSIDTNVEGIGHLLSDRLLAIPDYQRSYSWGSPDNDEVGELWRDLEEALASEAPEYFLGSIVTTRATGAQRVQVIDGQQRLATVSLMYAALRDILASRSDERAQDVERELLGKRDIVSREMQPRLVLNANDNDLFRRITLEPASTRGQLESTLTSHALLIKAFNFFLEQFGALIEGRGPEEWQEPLFRWYSYLLDRAQVIEVSVAGEARAFVIFETLNYRGLNLSTSDLLKNHLFAHASARVEEVKGRWQRAMGPFDASALEADTFLRHFWASKKGVVRVKALYSQMKPEINDEQSAVDLAEELAVCAPLWTAMFDRDADIWNSYSASALAALDTLRNLNVEQCRPLLLAAMRMFEPSQVEALLALVVGWSIRWSMVGGGGAGTVERLYAQAARRVTDGEVTEAAGVAALFTSVPSDLNFESAFASRPVRRGWLARYYLTVLERAKRGDTEPEFVPNQDVDEVNLEHVLPKNPDESEWPEFTPEEIQTYRFWLGNQVLLKKSHNRQIGNKPFAYKKPILAASELTLTREVGEKDQWNPEAVRERQEALAELAVQVWRRS